LESFRGYLNVACRLELLLAQVDHCPPSSRRVIYRGEVARKDTWLLFQDYCKREMPAAEHGRLP
jgi:hypothetical protein